MQVLDIPNNKIRECYAIMHGKTMGKFQDIYLVRGTNAVSIPELSARSDFELKWIYSGYKELKYEQGISDRFNWLKSSEAEVLDGNNADYISLLEMEV